MLSYELQVDDGQGGDFHSLLGNETSGDSLETSYVLGKGITEGGLYRFRYRARNVNGWSGFSPVAYLRAANAPGRPAAPILVSVDATAFTVRLPRAAGDGGSSILRYELWRNRGTGCNKNLYDCAEFIKVTGFDGLATTHTLTVGDGAADHLLTAGSIYLLRSVAVNSLQDVLAPAGDALAYSEASEELAVGLSSLPAAPASLTKVVSESTATYITLQWAQSADTELPVLGYLLSMKDHSAGDDSYTAAYNGTNYPNVRKFTVAAGVVSGKQYTFKVQAINFNGPGPASTEVQAYVCIDPGPLSPPILEAVSAVPSSSPIIYTMKLRWVVPANDGGCEITSYSILRAAGATGAAPVEIEAA